MTFVLGKWIFGLNWFWDTWYGAQQHQRQQMSFIEKKAPLRSFSSTSLTLSPLSHFRAKDARVLLPNLMRNQCTIDSDNFIRDTPRILGYLLKAKSWWQNLADIQFYQNWWVIVAPVFCWATLSIVASHTFKIFSTSVILTETIYKWSAQNVNSMKGEPCHTKWLSDP